MEPGRIGEKAGELAAQAAQVAAPALDKAKEVAGELADKAVPLVERAGELAAQGVSAAAEQIDRVTGGKFADQISSVSARIEDVLAPDRPETGRPPGGATGS